MLRTVRLGRLKLRRGLKSAWASGCANCRPCGTARGSSRLLVEFLRGERAGAVRFQETLGRGAPQSEQDRNIPPYRRRTGFRSACRLAQPWSLHRADLLGKPRSRRLPANERSGGDDGQDVQPYAGDAGRRAHPIHDFGLRANSTEQIPAYFESAQITQYAGYAQKDGSVIGDRQNVEFTRIAMSLRLSTARADRPVRPASGSDSRPGTIGVFSSTCRATAYARCRSFIRNTSR